MPDRLYHKILLIMRFTTVILIASLMQVSASGLAQKISLFKTNATLKSVINEIRLQSGYDFVYRDNLLKKARPVSINLKGVQIEEALKLIFDDQPFIYEINSKTVIVKAKESSFLNNLMANFRAIDVRGKVLDEKEEPLAGASVSIKGTGRSVKTSARGEFFLSDVQENDKLVISYIGYQTREVDAASDMGSLKMTLDNSELEEVKINAGYYSVSRRELTGSIAKVNSKDIENQPVTNVLSAVQGRMSGVNIIQNSGVPGGGLEIQIRGKNSIRREGNEVLYIIDGVPQSSETRSLYTTSILPWSSINPLNALNPNDAPGCQVSHQTSNILGKLPQF